MTVGTAAENHAFLTKLEETVASLRPRALKAAIQQYAWGLQHDSSLVSALGTCNCCTFNTFLMPKKGGAAAPPAAEHVGDMEKPFAELWMGTHPNGNKTPAFRHEFVISHGFVILFTRLIASR